MKHLGNAILDLFTLSAEVVKHGVNFAFDATVA